MREPLLLGLSHCAQPLRLAILVDELLHVHRSAQELVDAPITVLVGVRHGNLQQFFDVLRRKFVRFLLVACVQRHIRVAQSPKLVRFRLNARPQLVNALLARQILDGHRLDGVDERVYVGVDASDRVHFVDEVVQVLRVLAEPMQLVERETAQFGRRCGGLVGRGGRQLRVLGRSCGRAVGQGPRCGRVLFEFADYCVDHAAQVGVDGELETTI